LGEIELTPTSEVYRCFVLALGGLGHSANGASVMYATLTTGMTNRALAVADLNVPDSDAGACGLHAASSRARVEFSSADISVGTSSNNSGFHEQGDSLPTKQAALNAVLADWSSTTDFAGQVAHILNDGQNKGLLRGAGLPSLDDQNGFWSIFGGTTGLEKIITLTGDMV